MAAAALLTTRYGVTVRYPSGIGFTDIVKTCLLPKMEPRFRRITSSLSVQHACGAVDRPTFATIATSPDDHFARCLVRRLSPLLGRIFRKKNPALPCPEAQAQFFRLGQAPRHSRRRTRHSQRTHPNHRDRVAPIQ